MDSPALTDPPRRSGRGLLGPFLPPLAVLREDLRQATRHWALVTWVGLGLLLTLLAFLAPNWGRLTKMAEPVADAHVAHEGAGDIGPVVSRNGESAPGLLAGSVAAAAKPLPEAEPAPWLELPERWNDAPAESFADFRGSQPEDDGIQLAQYVTNSGSRSYGTQGGISTPQPNWAPRTLAPPPTNSASTSTSARSPYYSGGVPAAQPSYTPPPSPPAAASPSYGPSATWGQPVATTPSTRTYTSSSYRPAPGMTTPPSTDYWQPASQPSMFDGVPQRVPDEESAAHLAGWLLRLQLLLAAGFVIAMGASAIAGETEVAADAVLCRGIARWQYYLGKWGGRTITAIVVYAFLTLPAIGLSVYQLTNDITPWGLLRAVGLAATLLGSLTTLSVAASAWFRHSLLGVAITWMALYGFGLAVTLAPLPTLSPLVLAERIPDLLRGMTVETGPHYLLPSLLAAGLLGTFASCAHFCRKDV